jgi:hypothetical protein
MSVKQQGGCLCGNVRYEATAEPVRVTFCHCRYCQRATGGAYLVEPMFNKSDFKITNGTTRAYSQQSEGSGKRVTTNFCENCGTKLYLDIERFPEIIGVCGGTFDDPNWYARPPEKSRHFFLDFAQKGTVVPAGYDTFREQAVNNDGTLAEPTVYNQPHVIE